MDLFDITIVFIFLLTIILIFTAFKSKFYINIFSIYAVFSRFLISTSFGSSISALHVFVKNG